MCRQAESIEAVNRAADALMAACLKIAGGTVSDMLRRTYNDTLAEPVPPDMTAKLKGLQ